MAYIFGSIWDRYNRNALNDLSKNVEIQGKSIQDLVAEGQLTDEQYANLITSINGLVKSGQVDKSDLTPKFKDGLEDFQDATGFSLEAIIRRFNLEPIPDPIYVENLWNPSESTTGVISSSSGNINPHDSNRVSFPIPIKGGENYTLFAERLHGIYFYESEGGAYIEGTGWLASNEVRTIKAPDNANVARLTFSITADVNHEEFIFIVNIGNELMTEGDEGRVWDGDFWGEVPSPPLKENSVKNRHLSAESVTEDKLSYLLKQKINEGGGGSGGGTSRSGGDLGELYVYDESSSYSSGQEKTIADVDDKSEIDLIEFSSVEIKSELLIYYKESDGTEFLYDLITNDGTPAVANTFENMQLHGSAIVDFIDFDDLNNNFKIAIRNLKCANGFKVVVKNNGSTNRNIATRVVSRQYV